MISTSATLRIVILSRQCLVWLGLQNLLESSASVPMVVHPHQRWTPSGLSAETGADVFILDLESTRDAVGTVKQIRESSPTSKIVVLYGLDDQDRTRELLDYGIDGVVLNIQPPGVMLATIEALYAPAPHRVQDEHNGAVWVDLLNASNQKVDTATQPPARAALRRPCSRQARAAAGPSP